jgi:hypothetical protein
MLPWFCGLHDDDIDHADAGTFEDLSKAHRDLAPGPSSPSSYTNHYGAVNYAAPFAVRVVSENPISNALIAQARWDSFPVQSELNKILALKTPAAYQEYMATHRKMISDVYRKAFDKSMALELEYFPEKGYVKNKGDWTKLSAPDKVPYEDTPAEMQKNKEA